MCIDCLISWLIHCTFVPCFIHLYVGFHIHLHSCVGVSDKASAVKTTIPTKATLARSASSKRKVPPIPLSERSHTDKDDSQSHDSMLDDGYIDEEDRQVRVYRCCKKGIFWYIAVSNPLDRSKRFTRLHPMADLFIPTQIRLPWDAF